MPLTEGSRWNTKCINCIVKDPGEYVSLGKSSFKLSRYFTGRLIQKTAHSTIEFELKDFPQGATLDQFMYALDNYLARNNMYFVDVQLRDEQLGGVIPYKAKGNLYMKKEENIENIVS